jgi:hypothetical protein
MGPPPFSLFFNTMKQFSLSWGEQIGTEKHKTPQVEFTMRLRDFILSKTAGPLLGDGVGLRVGDSFLYKGYD